MESSPDLSGYLYVDGHVRVYHGKQTKLPRRYVSRERLCLRGMTDYWVNEVWGQPFFVVTTALTSGLLSMLKSEIIPRLLEAHRIACITYNKHPGEDWPQDEFVEEEVVFKNGEKITMKLAERRVVLSEMFWIREIRKLNEDGHQTSILSSNFKTGRGEIAGAIFKRWCQENFFK